MSENRISSELSVADRDQVLAAIATIKAKLPFLLALDLEDSKSLLRLGDKSRAFVAKALELATLHPEILPPSFDLEEFRLDLELFEALSPLVSSVSELQNLITDTSAVAGSEAYAAARQVYAYAKTAGLDAGLQPYLQDLGKRFRSTRRSGIEE